MDPISVVSHQSYFSRVGGSCRGLVVGAFLIFGSIGLLIWNESNAVETHRALYEGAHATTSLASPENIDPAYENKLVHLVGQAVTDEPAKDIDFGVSPPEKALKLERSVEMYQWVESSREHKKKNLDGSETTETVYTYSKQWRGSLVDSSRFQDKTKPKSQQHNNPSFMPYNSKTFTASHITFGEFTLTDAVTQKMNWFVPFGGLKVENIPDASVQAKTKLSGSSFYIGNSPASPAIGDVMVSFSMVKEQTISIVAKQVGDSFSAYLAHNGKKFLLVEGGAHSAEEMFQDAQNAATVQAWILRFVGFILLYIGLVQMAAPLAVAADIIPCVGGLVGAAASAIMFPIALVVSLTVIALSWIFVRPLLVIPLLLVMGGVVFYAIKRRQRNNSNNNNNAYVVGHTDDGVNDLELQETHMDSMGFAKAEIK